MFKFTEPLLEKLRALNSLSIERSVNAGIDVFTEHQACSWIAPGNCGSLELRFPWHITRLRDLTSPAPPTRWHRRAVPPIARRGRGGTHAPFQQPEATAPLAPEALMTFLS
eukprot:655900-Pelagomonas_calceolata.AAC.1